MGSPEIAQDDYGMRGMERELHAACLAQHRTTSTIISRIRLYQAIQQSITDDDIRIVCAESGRSDMIIDDQSLVELCRSFGFPVVLTGKAIPRNGNRLSTVMGDWDYRNKLTIRQTVTLASKAKAIVSTISWMRLCAQLVGTPVIEVLPLDSEAERNKVVFDYAHAYNLAATAGILNVWTDLCNRVELARQLERMLTGRK